ncbi:MULTISPECIES: hypothetical protein [Citrobacter]|jgi:ribosomal protein S8E|uniref:DUF4762 domain-containing protein n=1 Tax=Citrobacter werkmanii TaxID=67827 RepID=A0A9N8CQR5_9ENTR|nr:MULTISPECIES: hypothetical protein [Citrobacter]MBA8105439.1 hypothetical protein [Citrobacter sp. RHBSTW-00029]MBJ9569888.1 hypothetical protein [Citrobacter braakii]MDN4342492.1 hypothetical protein [Citrobacter freundii]QLR76878.1 hypothetical protein HV336_08215 [Citrobacter freundii]CAB5528376.1 Uncharacterised protein [Citrobacter werkmanii]
MVKRLFLAAVLAVFTVSAFAETTERCRINSAGDKVCTGKYGKITKRCHTSGNGTETCTTY